MTRREVLLPTEGATDRGGRAESGPGQAVPPEGAPVRRRRHGVEPGTPRAVDPTEGAEDDAEYDADLRPRRLEEFVGQRDLVEHLGIVLQAARGRRQPVDHILFAGPPGLGKTSLAGIVAAEMGVGLRVTSGP